MLTDIDLSNNQLSNVLPDLPAGVQNVSMSANAFTGGIPASYGAHAVATLAEMQPQLADLHGMEPGVLHSLHHSLDFA